MWEECEQLRGMNEMLEEGREFKGEGQFLFPLDVCLVPVLASWSQEPLQCAIEGRHGFVTRSWKRVSVLSSSCVSFCSGHQKLCVPDVELPRIHVQEPEHEAGAPSCQHICFRTNHKSPSRQRATFGRSPVRGITCFGTHLNQLVFVFLSNPIASCRVGLQLVWKWLGQPGRKVVFWNLAAGVERRRSKFCFYILALIPRCLYQGRPQLRMALLRCRRRAWLPKTGIAVVGQVSMDFFKVNLPGGRMSRLSTFILVQWHPLPLSLMWFPKFWTHTELSWRRNLPKPLWTSTSFQMSRPRDACAFSLYLVGVLMRLCPMFSVVIAQLTEETLH